MSVGPITDGGRLEMAFGQPTLQWTVEWTAVDAYPNLVTSYTIDRGRQYELDRTDGGRAVVEIADVDGILDPTNPTGPFYGQLEPLLQTRLVRRNPITGNWLTRFRGFVEDWDYAFDPSQKVNRLTVSLVDIFARLAAIEFQVTDPITFGDQPNKETAGQVWYALVEDDPYPCRKHMENIFANAGFADVPDNTNWYVLFSGNVQLWDSTYSPGENILTALQEACDGEFPGVGNCYTDRRGRFVFHGRFAKFDPLGIITGSGISTDTWDYHEWNVGDGAAVNASPDDTAHIREFAFNQGLSRILNQAVSSPQWVGSSTSAHPPTDKELKNQHVKDDTSITKYGDLSWSVENLLTKKSMLIDDHSGALAETKKFAQYYVDNYKTPHKRVTTIGFRSIQPDADYPGAAYTWELLSHIDISDAVNITVDSPGGGGFAAEGYFVEGIHEEVRALNPYLDDVTLRLDLSPRALYPSDYVFQAGAPDETGGGGGGGGDTGGDGGGDLGGFAPGDPAEMGAYASQIAAGAPALDNPTEGNPIKATFSGCVPPSPGLQYFGAMKDEGRVFGVGNWQDGNTESNCATLAPHIHVKFRNPPGGGNTTTVYV